MDDSIPLSELPANVREQILKDREARKPKVLSAIAPREFDAPFSTREIRELSAKIDELIEQHNLVYQELTKRNENPNNRK